MVKTVCITFLILLVANGCSIFSKRKPIIVQQQKLSTVQIPEELLKPCKSFNLPNNEEWKNLSPTLRGMVLSLTVVELLNRVAECNSRISGIREWNEEIIKVLGDENTSAVAQ